MIQNDTEMRKMTATVTTRVPESTLREINFFTAERHTDRSTLLRCLIEEGLANERQKKVLYDYKERKISLQRAAELIGIHLVEMLELIQREGLYMDYTEDELKEDLKGLPQ